jgi:hypothetical protein
MLAKRALGRPREQARESIIKGRIAMNSVTLFSRATLLAGFAFTLLLAAACNKHSALTDTTTAGSSGGSAIAAPPGANPAIAPTPGPPQAPTDSDTARAQRKSKTR